MLEEPEDFKEGNKINLITFSSTKYHIKKFNKISGFMLKKPQQKFQEEEQGLPTEHYTVQS